MVRLEKIGGKTGKSSSQRRGGKSSTINSRAVTTNRTAMNNLKRTSATSYKRGKSMNI